MTTAVEPDDAQAAALGVIPAAVECVLSPTREIPYDLLDVALHDVGGFTAEGKDAVLFHVAMITALLLRSFCEEAGSDMRRAWPRVIADLTRVEES